ncbi:hypothetical protein F5B18DRAFT_654052 [Nemania serpens]|nr:hypothetical protein F5B18DRAFT_654052 [Nemania serpens]
MLHHFLVVLVAVALGISTPVGLSDPKAAMCGQLQRSESTAYEQHPSSLIKDVGLRSAELGGVGPGYWVLRILVGYFTAHGSVKALEPGSLHDYISVELLRYTVGLWD